MGIFDASTSSGGSSNYSWSQASTDAASARAWSEQAATTAYERQKALLEMQQKYNSAEAAAAREFNSAEAEKARAWQLEQANSIYQRTMADMQKAGVNPILAYNIGLSGAGVGSGATASGMAASSSAGSAPLAQNFMDSASSGYGAGSSWNSSESGLATALTTMGNLIGQGLATLSSAMDFDKLTGSDLGQTVESGVVNKIKAWMQDNENFRNGVRWDRDDNKTQGYRNGVKNGIWNSFTGSGATR